VLALLTGVSYLFVRGIERDNPRRDYLERLWPSVAEGVPASTAIQLLGAADEEREVRELVSAGDTSSRARSAPGEFHTCVRERVWYVSPAERSGHAYMLCEDRQGIVRRKKQGMAFDLKSF
jgi:hypothetical protein